VRTELPVVSSGRWWWWRCLQTFCKVVKTRGEVGKMVGKPLNREGAGEGYRSTTTFSLPARIYSMASSSPATASPQRNVGEFQKR
jgi:hypothetical protein